MIKNFQLIRNIGQFSSFSSKDQLELDRFNLIYAENGRGKTTLAAILKSLGTCDKKLIVERHRLGADHEPHIVINADGKSLVFHNGDWTDALPNIIVFDDAFVAQNICSGIDIAPEHRQALHELIIGDKGVKLNTIVKNHIARVEEHNRELKRKEQAIPSDIRGSMSVEDFCTLKHNPNIEAEIDQAEKSLAAARSADKVQKAKHFSTLEVPSFDMQEIQNLLNRGLSEIDQEAANHVQKHFASLGEGGEDWISKGMKRIEGASEGREGEICPFCAQELQGSEIIDHYRIYFSQAYTNLKNEIAERSEII